MRATQFVLLSVAVAIALSQPPAASAVRPPVGATSCWNVAAGPC